MNVILIFISLASVMNDIKYQIENAELLLKSLESKRVFLDTKKVRDGLSKNTAVVRCNFELQIPDTLKYIRPLHSVQQDGGSHDGRWVGHSFFGLKNENVCEDFDVTAIVARKDDHNPFL